MPFRSFICRACAFARTVLHTAVAYARWIRVLWRSRAHPRLEPSPIPRALLLVAALPPAGGGGVVRPTALLRFAARCGWRIAAVTQKLPPSPMGMEFARFVPADLSISRFDDPLLWPSWKFFPRIDGGFHMALAMCDAAVRAEGGIAPSVVIASGPPFYSFVAGYYLARRYRVPLVLDYRDDWSENPHDYVCLGGQDRAWELRCLNAASRVIFATGALQEHQLRRFPSQGPSTYVTVTNGWDAELAAASSDDSASNEFLTLSFVGTLSSHQAPRRFLESLEQVLAANPPPSWAKRLRLCFVGRQEHAAAAELEGFSRPDLIECVGEVSLSRAQAEMRRSNALLFFATPQMARYRSSKIYEYAAAAKPVLVYGHRGDTSDLVEELGIGLFVAEGDDAGLNAALTAIDDGSFRVATRRTAGWLAAHTREAVTRRFFEALPTSGFQAPTATALSEPPPEVRAQGSSSAKPRQHVAAK